MTKIVFIGPNRSGPDRSGTGDGPGWPGEKRREVIAKPDNRAIGLWLALRVPPVAGCRRARKERHIRAGAVLSRRIGRYRPALAARCAEVIRF